jgi:dienelactone hydrolase
MAWLRDRPEAKGQATALLGVSRGSELALLATSLDPSLAHTIIALVPGAYVLQGLPGGAVWTRNGRAISTGDAIPVERIRGTVLVAGAKDDHIWDSAGYANTIARTIAMDGRARVVRRVYTGAGHGLATPIPFIPDVANVGLGGTGAADERAREDLWPLILNLLSRGAEPRTGS